MQSPYDAAPPAIVLDTNAVLDWLLFQDRRVATLAGAIAGRRVRWLATPAMRDELRHVLERGLAARRSAETSALLAAWDAHAIVVAQAEAHPLRCADPDDQIFVDLGLASGARWLISRDRALLKLARGAAPLGLRIVEPSRWAELP
jgi:putative PIN family toxin of toxin-antitoxin system